MAMEITKSFSVKAPPDAVWAFLTDLHRVAQCMPGAAIGEKLDDKTYTGTMTVKVGPVMSSYKGKIVFERLDPATRTAELRASGQDVRGKGGADLQLVSSLKPKGPGETEVIAVSQVSITGLLAQMGRGMVQDVSDQIFQKFSENMRAELEAPAAAGAPAPPSPAPGTASAEPPPPPRSRPSEPALDVVALGGTAARHAAGRLVRRPVFWVVVAAVVIVLYLLFR
jgi:uncharacterized protein